MIKRYQELSPFLSNADDEITALKPTPVQERDLIKLRETLNIFESVKKATRRNYISFRCS